VCAGQDGRMSWRAMEVVVRRIAGRRSPVYGNGNGNGNGNEKKCRNVIDDAAGKKLWRARTRARRQGSTAARPLTRAGAASCTAWMMNRY
jgi:hypothetical protein